MSIAASVHALCRIALPDCLRRSGSMAAARLGGRAVFPDQVQREEPEAGPEESAAGLRVPVGWFLVFLQTSKVLS